MRIHFIKKYTGTNYSNNNNNNRNFLIYKLLTPPCSKMRFEANLSREDSQSKEQIYYYIFAPWPK